MKNILVTWNGMASEQISGGDVYIRELLKRVDAQKVQLCIQASGPAIEITKELHYEKSVLYTVDTKRSQTLGGLLWRYLKRTLVASMYAINHRRQVYDFALASSPFLYDVMPVIFSRSRCKAVVIFHLLPSRSGKKITTKLRFTIARFEQQVTMLVVKRYFDTILAGNSELRDVLKSRFPNKTIVVADAGIDTSKLDMFMAQKQEDRIVFIGRLTQQKGVYDIIEVAKAMQVTDPAVEFIVVGDGPDFQNLQSLCINNHLENVRMLGYVSDAEKYRLLNSATFFIFPSYEEGWGIALAEALYANCICVTYELDHYRGIFGAFPYYVQKGNIDELIRTVKHVRTKKVSPQQRTAAAEYEIAKVIGSVLTQLAIPQRPAGA
jgi:glycosyltransferase involved in cell wall biosynthesis